MKKKDSHNDDDATHYYRDDGESEMIATTTTTTTSRCNNSDTSTITSTTSWLSPVIQNILVVETAERFAYFGFRAILVLYFTTEFYTETQAIASFAYVTMMAYMSPLLGAMLADGPYLGRYKTIWYFGMIYILGLGLLAMAAFISSKFWTWLGLFLVCLGTGGIKPCVSSFGADQVVAVNNAAAATATVATMDEEEDNKKLGIGKEEGLGAFMNSSMVDQREAAVASSTASVNHTSNASNDSTKKDEQVRAFFAYFYFCINVGALTSIALVPLVKAYLGFGFAFGLAWVFMMTAMLLFWNKRHDYVHNTPSDSNSMTLTFCQCWWIVRHNLWSLPWIAKTLPFWKPPLDPPSMSTASQATLGRTSSRYKTVPRNGGRFDDYVDGNANYDDTKVEEEDQEEEETRKQQQHQQLSDAAQVVRVMPIMAMFPIFWCLYDQQGSVWVLQAGKMGLLGPHMQPEQTTIINPLEIMLFIPLFDRYVYPALQARGVCIAPLRRIAWGMVLTAIAFYMSALVERAIQYRAEHDLPKLNVLWQLPQLTVLSIAEIFLSVTALEFAYSSSPDRLKAFVTSIYLLTTAVGDMIGGMLYSTVFAEMNLASVMEICAALMVCNLGLFCLVKRWWDRNELHRRNDTTTGSNHFSLPRSNSSQGHEGLELLEQSPGAVGTLT